MQCHEPSKLEKKKSLSKNATICAVDCLFPELAARALDVSIQKCSFKEAILFTDEEIEGKFNCVKIQKIKSILDYNDFLLNKLHNYIRTEFVIVIQWDGYITNPKAWDDVFFEYDYIGAVWPQYAGEMNVGNGGFSLRSKRLLDAITDNRFKHLNEENEDNAICRTNRAFLEREYGINFADEEIANKFSYEQTTPLIETFGFHGLWNIWRHEPDDVAISIINRIPPKYYREYMMQKTLMSYYLAGNDTIFLLLFRKTLSEIDVELLSKILIYALNFNKNSVISMIRRGKFLLAKEKFLNFLGLKF